MKDFEIREARDYKVVKANEIIQKARYELSLQELKMLAYIFSKIKPDDKPGAAYTFSIKEYCQICGIDYGNGGNYEKVKAGMKALRDKSFWLMDENGDETTVGWIGKATMRARSGNIAVKLDEDLEKYIHALFNNFTQYELIYTLPMKSAYSFRMYEILKSYAFINNHTFNVDGLKKQLMAEKYKNFKDFRINVLDRATREINEYTDIEVNWEPVMCGKKVEEVIFHIRTRDPWDRYIQAVNANDTIEGQLSIFDMTAEEFKKNDR